MKKALFYGILASFFFAFTFLLNRSMHCRRILAMVCMPALSFYLSYPCCGTGNFRKKAKNKASFTYLGRNNKSSRRMVSLEQCWFCTVLCAFNF